MTPSPDAHATMLPPPGPEAFPAGAAHSVAPYVRPNWSAGLARWWHAVFKRNAYARGPDMVRSGRSSHRFFQHLIEPAAEPADAAPGDGETRET